VRPMFPAPMTAMRMGCVLARILAERRRPEAFFNQRFGVQRASDKMRLVW
jgi:hypothetical protein